MLDDYPDIDGVVPITHESGCGMACSGEGFDVLAARWRARRRHPNFPAVLLVGLGCEAIRSAG